MDWPTRKPPAVDRGRLLDFHAGQTTRVSCEGNRAPAQGDSTGESQAVPGVAPGPFSYRRPDCQASSAASAPTPAPVAAPPPETFEQLLQRFLKAAAALPEPERAEAAKRVGQAGLAAVDTDAVLEVTADLRQGLGLPADRQPSLQSLVELCVLLVEVSNGLTKRRWGR